MKIIATQIMWRDGLMVWFELENEDQAKEFHKFCLLHRESSMYFYMVRLDTKVLIHWPGRPLGRSTIQPS